MSVILALAASISYGVGDFVGGLAAKRGSAFAVAFCAGIGGILGMLVFALMFPGNPRGADFLWGALGGLGNGIGGAFLYRGLAAGRMGVVAPVSALTSALLPVAVALLLGERPSPLAWAGILLALPAIWLISREPGGPGGSTAAGVIDGLLAGVGFGVLFIATGQIAEGAGFWPLVVNQLACLPAVILLAVLLRERWQPMVRAEAAGLLSGLLSAGAVLGFMLAAQRGLLSVSSVLTALYPAATVALASIILKERLNPAQWAGLALAAVAVVLIALG